MKDFETTCHAEALISHIKSLGLCLPGTVEGLYDILLELYEFGFLLLLGNRNAYDIVFDIPKLTSDVHKLLFSDKKQLYKDLQTNTGIVSEDILQEILPAHITSTHLVHLQYCQQIQQADIGAFLPLDQQAPGKSFLFFPALCNMDKSEVVWEEASGNTFSIGWLARCTEKYDYFPPRFLHILLLRLVFGFALPAHTQRQNECVFPMHGHRCTMWKRGVHWLTEEDADCMVEILGPSQQNSDVVVLTKSFKECEEECVSLFSDIIQCVMETKAEFCHSIKPQFFLLDSTSEANYLSEDNMFDLSDVRNTLAHPHAKVIVSVSGRGKMKFSKLQCMRKLTLWNNLFPMHLETVVHLLKYIVGNELYELGEGLGASCGVLKTIEADFTTVNQRRRELVKWWMNSSPRSPSWWHLVQALKRTTYLCLAEKAAKEHESHICLQKKMLDPANQALKPDQEFLQLLSVEVGSKWPSLAVSLELSEEEIAGLKEKAGSSHEEIAFKMLNIWASREDATYSMLCQILNTVTLFHHIN